MRITVHIIVSCLLLMGLSLKSAYSSTESEDKNSAAQHTLFSILPENHLNEIKSLIQKIEKKSDAKEAYFLEYIFYKTHRKFLKNYEKHSSIKELFTVGEYDCVSGSLLYASLLDHFNISYKVVETDFHVFLIVQSDGKEYILESTDPLNGFIKDQEEVAAYKLRYQPKTGSLGLSSAIEIGDNKYINNEDNTIYNEINITQLSGLQYYNKGIEALNEHKYQSALVQLIKANDLYPSERIASILEICKSLAK